MSNVSKNGNEESMGESVGESMVGLYRDGLYRGPEYGGSRVKGWEDVNIQLLAEKVGITAHNLRQQLSGRQKITLQRMQVVARVMRMSVHEVVKRIEHAQGYYAAKKKQGVAVEVEGQ